MVNICHQNFATNFKNKNKKLYGGAHVTRDGRAGVALQGVSGVSGVRGGMVVQQPWGQILGGVVGNTGAGLDHSGANGVVAAGGRGGGGWEWWWSHDGIGKLWWWHGGGWAVVACVADEGGNGVRQPRGGGRGARSGYGGSGLWARGVAGREWGRQPWVYTWPFNGHVNLHLVDACIHSPIKGTACAINLISFSKF